MIVTTTNFDDIVHKLYLLNKISLDTETTGLYWYKGDRLFSIIIGHEEDGWYFNFHKQPDIKDHYVLPREWIKHLAPILNDYSKTVYMHNAKFDMSMLKAEGVEKFECNIHCTQTGARVEYNDHILYNLDACGERIGVRKDDTVSKLVSKKKFYTIKKVPGKKTKTKFMHYEKVPFAVMVDYGIRDALITYKLGEHQTKIFDDSRGFKAVPPLWKIMGIEKRLTKALFTMENRGILIDIQYCKKASEYNIEEYNIAAAEFEANTGIEFKDSNKVLAQAFTALGEEFPETDKGNPSFTDKVLEGFDTPVAKLVKRYRDAYKKAHTYFEAYLYWADENGRVHCRFNQAGAGTGRMSCSEPNLQNVTSDEKDKVYPIRRAFVPSKDHCFVMIDYDQMEFRMMVDYAKQQDLADKIKLGHDPHQATADLVGIGRKPAKTLNFGLLYGMGAGKLADQLGVTRVEAEYFREKYFSALPHVKDFMRTTKRVAERRGYVYTWSGRRSYFKDPRFAYKAGNSIIQGGAADVAKASMLELDSFLKPFKSAMLLQIHDEVLFEVHKDEFHIVPELKAIMERHFPYKILPLTCSVSHSFKSWGDKVDGPPIEFSHGRETRDNIQEENLPVLEETEEDVCGKDSAGVHTGDVGLSSLC